MKKVISLLIVAMMVLGLASCSSQTQTPADTTVSTTSAAPKAKNSSDTVLKLQWFQAIGIDTLFENPWHDFQSLYPTMVFDSLIAQNSDGALVPRLATDWSVSKDGSTYTFTIRDGVKWQDGEPFKVDDVVWTLNTALKAPDSTSISATLREIAGSTEVESGKADTLSGVTADGNVLTVKLANPDSNFLPMFAGIYILPKHLLGSVAPVDLSKNEAFWSHPIGTGAFKIDEVHFPDYFTAVPNENYYGAKPGIPKVLFTSYNTGGNDAVVAALIAGDLDFVFGNAINDITVASNIVAKNPDVVSKLQISNYMRMFAFNLEARSDKKNKPDLKKEEVRQAFNLIIDKDAMASLYKGQAMALSTLVNPQSSWYNKDIPLHKRDVDKAVSMLKEAGFDFKQTIDVAYYYDDQTTNDLMSLLVQNFADAGITIKTTLLSGDLATLIYKTANYDMIYLAASCPAPVQMFLRLTTSSSFTFIGDNEKRKNLFDSQYASALAATEQSQQKSLCNQLQVLGYQSAYILPVYSLNTIQMYNSKNVTIPEDIFGIDNLGIRNMNFDKWSLTK